MGIMEPEQVVGRVIFDVMPGVIQSPGCEAQRANGVLFILV